MFIYYIYSRFSQFRTKKYEYIIIPLLSQYCCGEAIIEEIRKYVPKMKENGGYIFSSDHSIPNTVTLENFKAIVNEVKQCGVY